MFLELQQVTWGVLCQVQCFAFPCVELAEVLVSSFLQLVGAPSEPQLCSAACLLFSRFCMRYRPAENVFFHIIQPMNKDVENVSLALTLEKC